MLEYEKYNELQAKSQRMQEDYENQLRDLERSKQGGLEELTEFYEAKLRETCARLEQVLVLPTDRPPTSCFYRTKFSVSVKTSMLVLLIVWPKCTLAASHAASGESL